MKHIVLALLVAALLAPFASARGSSSGHSSSRSRVTAKAPKVKPARNRTRPAKRCAACARDSKGRIARSPHARRQFQKTNPCPATGKTTGGCRGYVIDHIVPLKRGGADAPSNMQWQTKATAKAKDKIE